MCVKMSLKQAVWSLVWETPPSHSSFPLSLPPAVPQSFENKKQKTKTKNRALRLRESGRDVNFQKKTSPLPLPYPELDILKEKKRGATSCRKGKERKHRNPKNPKRQ
jgi:hypothetical protein